MNECPLWGRTEPLPGKTSKGKAALAACFPSCPGSTPSIDTLVVSDVNSSSHERCPIWEGTALSLPFSGDVNEGKVVLDIHSSSAFISLFMSHWQSKWCHSSLHSLHKAQARSSWKCSNSSVRDCEFIFSSKLTVQCCHDIHCAATSLFTSDFRYDSHVQ